MRIIILTISKAVTFLTILFLCTYIETCGGSVKNRDLQTNNQVISETHMDSPYQKDIIGANNYSVIDLDERVVSFNDYLYVGSFRGGFVFYDRDNEGNYHSWKEFNELFEINGISKRSGFFKYKNQLFFMIENVLDEDEIIIFNMDFSIQSRKKIGIKTEVLFPEYIYGNKIYCSGHSQVEPYYGIIKSIDLDSFEEKIIYSYSYDTHPYINYLVDWQGKIIIYEYIPEIGTRYFSCEDEILEFVLETQPSVPVHSDYRGIFYLEDTDVPSYKNLKLWDGKNSRFINKIRTDNMNDRLFANGIAGNIIIEENFFITIHSYAEEPYLLIHSFDSTETKTVQLKKWPFTEADMERFGETFSGIYYKNGQMLEYFFSESEGMLQTNVVDIEKILYLCGAEC